MPALKAALFLSLCLALAALAGCGDSTSTTANNPNPSPTPTTPTPSPGPATTPPPSGGTSGISAGAFATTVATRFFGATATGSTSAAAPGSPYSTLLPTIDIGMASNNLLFVLTGSTAGPGPGTVLTFRVDTATGTPTQISSDSQTPTPAAIAVDASGNFLYVHSVTAAGDAIFGYAVSSSGALTPVPRSPFTGLSFSGGTSLPVISPDGKFLCIDTTPARTNDVVHCFTRNTSTGELLDVPNGSTPLVSNNGFDDYTFTPSGALMVAVSGSANQVQVQNAGATSSAGTRTASSGGDFPRGVAVHPNNGFVAVANRNSNNVVIFSLDGSGNLAQVGSTVVTGAPGRVAFSRNGQYLFVMTEIGGLRVFTFNSGNGSLTPTTGIVDSGNICSGCRTELTAF